MGIKEIKGRLRENGRTKWIREWKRRILHSTLFGIHVFCPVSNALPHHSVEEGVPEVEVSDESHLNILVNKYIS